MTAMGTTPFWARCECGHTWVAAYAPMDLAKFAKVVGRATCPKCAETKKIYLAKQDNGVLIGDGK